ncbi:porin family protein [Pontibacter cellulosilyticus]|uniref:PorT family protein n=1 Tax=Pontibacter cellulosilyticus TaxID=1720253 RepID=A0A923N891_9BACT|nr:porin family protein [Pontibacter cellulosilyticus]MBC5994009.1 PorT family protein [Pontibacter cellulosilyticus]
MRIKILLLVMGLVGSNSYAQVTIDTRLGLNLSKIALDREESETDGLKPGYFGGVSAQVRLTEKRFVRAELLYSEKGNKYPPSTLSPSGAVSSFHYASVGWYHGLSPAKRLFLIIGPQVGYLLSASTRLDSGAYDITEYYNRFDVSAELGIEYRVTRRMGVETRYSHGFKVIMEHRDHHSSGGANTGKLDGAHRMIQIGVNYRLKLADSEFE